MDAYVRLDYRWDSHSPLMWYIQSTIILIYYRLHYSFFLTWWMANGMWDYLIKDDEWPASISKRVKFLQRIARHGFRNICPYIIQLLSLFVLFSKHWLETLIRRPTAFSLLCYSLILSGSCWDHGEIPWKDCKRKREWRCPSLAKAPWGIKAR